MKADILMIAMVIALATVCGVGLGVSISNQVIIDATCGDAGGQVEDAIYCKTDDGFERVTW